MGGMPVARTATAGADSTSLAILVRLRNNGVYVALALLVLFNLFFTTNFATAGTILGLLSRAALAGDVRVARRVGIDAGDRDRGHRFIRWGDHGDSLGRRTAQPRIHLARGRARGAHFLCSGWHAERLPGRLRRNAAYSRHARALCRRARVRPGPRERTASNHQRSGVSGPVTGDGLRGSDAGGRGRRRGRPGRCAGEAHDVWALRACGRRQPDRELPVGASCTGRDRRRLRYQRSARRDRRHPRDGPVGGWRPRCHRPPDRARRYRRRGDRRHPALWRPDERRWHGRGAILMLVISATFVMNNINPIYAQILKAAIIVLAVYIQQGRREA